MRRPIDWSLYLVTDRAPCAGRPLEDVVEAALRGGVTVVQLREKACSAEECIALARRLQPILAAWDVPLIINDRVDVAMAVGADGVHVGQGDMAPDAVRRMVGGDMQIGLSVETLQQVEAAAALDVDCLGVSPVFATPTKTDTGAAWGLDGLRTVRGLSRLPLVAIGGIHEGNVEDVVRAGADGVAVVSAICAAGDAESAARRLRQRIDVART